MFARCAPLDGGTTAWSSQAQGSRAAEQMNPTSIEITATVLFALAVLHTFTASRFMHFAHRFREGSVGENQFHLLGEVEVVFGLWAGVLIAVMALTRGGADGHHGQRRAHLSRFTGPRHLSRVQVRAGRRRRRGRWTNSDRQRAQPRRLLHP